MLLRNTLWSLAGEGLPLVAAVVSIPLLISSVGVDGFGALTLIWALLGYLALLDMGLVRSMVQIVAERLGGDDPRPPAETAVPAVALIAVLGLAAGAGLAVFAGPLARLLTASDPVAVDEMRRALYVAALIAPTALISSALRGLLEAHQRFRAVNLTRMTVGVLNYLSPLAVLPFNNGLAAVVAAILAGRLLGLAAFAWACRGFFGSDRRWGGANFAALRPLFSMGAWMTLNNLIGPAMMYADRFVLGSVAATAAVAYYTVPFEMTTRLLFIPTAVASVLFPLAARNFRRAPETVPLILALGGGALLATFAVGLGVTALLGEWLLRIWLGGDFARESAPVLTVLMLGVMLNAVAYAPYALLQGIGRVDLTARLQLAELPVYLLVLYFLVHRFGPLGAAAAWSLRTGADLFLLLFLLSRHAPQAAAQALRLGGAALVAAVAAVLGLRSEGGAGMAGLLFGQGLAAILAAVLFMQALRSPAGRGLMGAAAVRD
jgi:O-antigen/teichoic acid export membrane protein